MSDIYCQRCGAATEERFADGKFRPVCPACGQVVYLDPKLAVAVVIERDGRLLLGRRGPTTAQAGRWSFPAGFVERGERVEDAARREAAEETGLRVTLGPLLGLYSTTGETVVLAVYAAAMGAGEPSADDDLTELAWFAPDELPELAFPHDIQILADWQARQLPDRDSG
ncbi:MAG TPA: NUDIX hydrolase [Thermomicrobiales bacterium]|nr:NUDIX hydrolase [Thermomicrobiales bacterium]